MEQLARKKFDITHTPGLRLGLVKRSHIESVQLN